MNTSVVPMSQQAARRARKTEWQRRNRAAFVKDRGYSTTSNYGAGGMRAAVLSRDGSACVKCGMTDEEHKAKWGRPITIDHRDRNRSNNALQNLQTMCLTCHGAKDLLPRLRTSKVAEFLPAMRWMRANGSTYQQVADAYGVSIATAYKYLRGTK